MKIVKRNNSRKRITVVYGKYGLKFSPEVTPHLRKVIEDGEKSLREGTAVRCTLEELMSFLRSLHD